MAYRCNECNLVFAGTTRWAGENAKAGGHCPKCKVGMLVSTNNPFPVSTPVVRERDPIPVDPATIAAGPLPEGVTSADIMSPPAPRPTPPPLPAAMQEQSSEE